MHLLSISTSYRYYQKQGGTLTEEEYKKLIRSYLKKPISFPQTTNVKMPCIGGVLVENY